MRVTERETTLNIYNLNKLLGHAVEDESINVNEQLVYYRLHSVINKTFGEEFFKEWHEYENIVKYLYRYGEISKELLNAAELYEQVWKKFAFLKISKDLMTSNPKLLTNVLRKLNRLNEVKVDAKADFADEKLNSSIKIDSSIILDSVEIYSDKIRLNTKVQLFLRIDTKNERVELIQLLSDEFVVEMNISEFIDKKNAIRLTKDYKFNFGKKWNENDIPVIFMAILHKFGILWTVFYKCDSNDQFLLNFDYKIAIDAKLAIKNKNVSIEADENNLKKCGAFVYLDDIKDNLAITMDNESYRIVKNDHIYPITDVRFKIDVLFPP
jgi:hypothetical protein